MSKRMLFAACLATALFFSTGTTQAQDPQAPFPEKVDAGGHPALSGILEDDFTKMILTCMPGQSTNKHLTLQKSGGFLGLGGAKKPATAIPSVIQSSLITPDRYVQSPVGQTLGSLFTYIYSASDQATDADTTPDPSRRLTFNLGSASDISQTSLANTQYSGTVYGQTCDSSLAGNVSASGGYSVPIADLKASLAASASSTTSWSLQIFDGTFDSPIPALFQTFDPKIALYPRLILWKWYYDQFVAGNATSLTTPNYLLQRMQGLSIYQVYGNKQTYTTQASVSASLSAAFLQTSGTLAAQSNSGITTNITAFQVMTNIDAATGRGSRRWAPLLTPQQLSSQQFPASLQEDYKNSIVAPNVTHVEHQVSAGFPRAVCAPSLWTVLGTDGNPIQGLSLTSVLIDPSSSSASDVVPCVFGVSYIVPATVPPTGIPLKYNIVLPIDTTKSGVANAVGGGNAFVIPAAPVTLVTADGPNMSPGLYVPKFQVNSVGAGFSTISWTPIVQVAETAIATIAAGSTPTLSAVSVTCGTQSWPITPSNVQLTQVAGSKQLQLAASMNVQDSSYNLTATSGWPTCYLNGSVTFALAAGPSVSRPLAPGQGLAVLFPVPPPPSAPTTLAAATTASQVTLTWSGPSSSGTTFNLYRGTSTGTEGTVPYKTGLTSATYVDTNVSHGPTYYYVVTSVTPAGESSKSTEASIAP